ncbi:ribosomal protein L7/L12 [Terrabacter sp. Ter38]|uniref:ribosomal protein L7/L12 n=1 Tax=Terrabacter sp. Ter38 TaxID=2926030 RepID=UPI00211878A4|nr:ribosomal protein L7/L12 [Terrabacter sp. Ter38]
MHPLVKLVLIVIIVVLAIVVWGRIMGRKDPDRELVGLTDTVRAKVSREISAGHKINAIKIYREATGAPLADAKRAVDSWFVPGQGPGVRDAAASYTDGRLTDEARSRISELILAGRREDAMSLYAEATGASGAEAQAIIRTWDTTQNY